MARQVKLKGTPLDLEGPELKVGDRAPDVRLKKSLVDDYRISEGNGQIRLISVVPSLDTPVCALQTRRFNEEANKLPGVQFLTVSMDLPPAQGRFCSTEGIDTNRLMMLSDHMDGAFGKAYGTLISALRIECRALFVVDKDGTIRHAEYVPEVGEHPNYDAALAVLKTLQ
ncbi:MAG TPA: thiol peroxidase [Phycisphaerae bacterium]|jgi:thiol peroxidase|nr:thiol peroxidase [Phycisphaerae bacterium]HOB75805.1 thiol peroxidase [Phycisphaerae bacterium]HOJ54568.1 thiol peroxidase [Phycisphaerae bacterium]HOL27039.1 thiol peroxidase [Phycisphaerae bacterium]HPP22809.1 thiol peroxidase [Phycisphaerae bacterium]